MTALEFIKFCWKHYLVLEEDFLKIERYISFETNNYNSYSVEFSKQYQAICSEVDVVCKIYCKVLNANSNAEKVLEYGKEILSGVPDIKNAIVKTRDNEIVLEPLKEWSTNLLNPLDGNDPLNRSPHWWKMYNKVKHQRLDLDASGKPYYMQANLENTMNALAGLFVLCMSCYKELCVQEGETIRIPLESSRLFIYSDWETGTLSMGNGFVCIDD